MSLLRLVISSIAIIASCNASGIGVIPAVRSFPIVRYAPFYNFPNTVRSIHAVSPAFPAVAPSVPYAHTPVLPPPPAVAAPAPLFTPFVQRVASPPVPAPVFARGLPSAPFSPIVRAVAPAFPGFAPAGAFPPAPVFPAPAPVFSAPAPVFPAPAPVFSAPAPVFPAPAPVFSAPAPVFSAPAPVFPAPAPVFPAPALPPPGFTSAPHIAFARALGPRFVGPAPLPSPYVRPTLAWK